MGHNARDTMDKVPTHHSAINSEMPNSLKHIGAESTNWANMQRGWNRTPSPIHPRQPGHTGALGHQVTIHM